MRARILKGITTRIVVAALGFAVPLAVLTWIVVQHERSEIAATRREQVGLAYARPALSALTALRTLRLVQARCSAAATAGPDCSASRAAAIAAIDHAFEELAREHAERGAELGVSAEPLAARESAESDPDAMRVAWQAARDAVVAAATEAPIAEEESTVALIEASVEDFAALRMPGEEPEEAAALDPLVGLEDAMAALVTYVSNAAGLTADRDRDADNAIDAAIHVLPLMAGDATRLTIIRGNPDVRSSSESAVIAQLVGERELPLAMDRIAAALSEDVRTWGESDVLQRTAPEIMERLAPDARALAATVPALDEEEQRAYLVRGTAFVRAVGAASEELASAADDLLVRRVVALEQRLAISLTIAAIVTLLTSLVVLRAIRTVLRPLSELASAAQRVAEGDLKVRVAVRRDDEVGAVARGFNRMTEAVAERDASLQEHAEMLEDLVTQKTESLQAILDSMGEGLLVTDMRGVLQPERSKWIEQWLGPVQPGTSLAAYLAPDDENLSDSIALGIEEIAADILPFEMLAAQMPRRIQRDGRELRLAYRAIDGGAGRERRLVVTLRDATVEIAKERLDRQQRELPAVVGLLVRNRAWFQGSVDEIELLLAEVADPSAEENVRTRALHTIKGSSAIMGFAAFAAVCHEFEDAIADEGIAALDDERCAMLRAEWDDAIAPVRAMLGEGEDSIQISRGEHQHFLDAVQRATDRAQLLAEARSWARDRVEDVMRPAACQAQELATRLGKRVEIDLQGGWRRLPEGTFRTFFSTLVHVVRNAVHHGIESPEERLERGKPEFGTLTISVEEPERGRIRVRLEDDGRGIDWAKVREAAERKGLRCATHEDLVEALFTDGVSTAGQVTDISGRGVGLAAVLAACRAHQGTVTVEARPGRGTSFVFDMRTPVMRASSAPVASAVA